MATKKAEAKKLTSREVADAIGTTPRQLRVFLRASEHYTNAGAGSRYEFTSSDVGPMKTRFEAWTKQKAEEKARREAVQASADEQEPTPAENEAPARRARKAAS